MLYVCFEIYDNDMILRYDSHNSQNSLWVI